MINVLVIDDPCGPSLYNKISYSDFVDTANDNVELLIISGSGAISEKDKKSALKWIELKSPTLNGTVELVAQQWHRELIASGNGGIHQIYTKQEDLILRAAYLRELLKISTGLMPSAAECFRDKVKMKQIAQQGGFSVPPFKRVHSPSCILSFIESYGFPVIIKPSLGSASAAVTVFRTNTDVEQYLATSFFDGIDSAGKHMDFSGDMIIEKFVQGTMYHVNGYAADGVIQYVWPFQYLQTNLDFASGKAYGNILIAHADSRYGELLSAAQRLLHILPSPKNLIFHLELFQSDGDFVLCEIAARRPGGSIGCLIDSFETASALGISSETSHFHELEFRCNLGLSSRFPVRGSVAAKPTNDIIVADLVVPHKIGVLGYIPGANEPLPVPSVVYRPIGKLGTVYRGFDINVMNTAARFLSSLTLDSSSTYSQINGDDLKLALNKAHSWFSEQVIYDPLPSSKIKELQIETPDSTNGLLKVSTSIRTCVNNTELAL